MDFRYPIQIALKGEEHKVAGDSVSIILPNEENPSINFAMFNFILAELDEFSISGVGLVDSFASYRALGQANFDSAHSGFTMANIGSTGQDGIAVRPHMLSQYASFGIQMPSGALPDSAVIDIEVGGNGESGCCTIQTGPGGPSCGFTEPPGFTCGDDGPGWVSTFYPGKVCSAFGCVYPPNPWSLVDYSSGFLSLAEVEGNIVFSPDFAKLGAVTYTAQVFDNGGIVAEFIGISGGFVESPNLLPAQIASDTTSIIVIWPTDHFVEFEGGAAGESGNMLRFIPEDLVTEAQARNARLIIYTNAPVPKRGRLADLSKRRAPGQPDKKLVEFVPIP